MNGRVRRGSWVVDVGFWISAARSRVGLKGVVLARRRLPFATLARVARSERTQGR